jgi:hypothetical protein
MALVVFSQKNALAGSEIQFEVHLLWHINCSGNYTPDTGARVVLPTAADPQAELFSYTR